MDAYSGPQLDVGQYSKTDLRLKRQRIHSDTEKPIGRIETFPYVGALVWLSLTVLCLTWPRQLGGMACKTQDYVSPLKNTPVGDSFGKISVPKGLGAVAQSNPL